MRLGHDGTDAFLETLELSQKEVKDAVIATCTERFERRLVDECSGLRVQMAQLGADLRREMGEMRIDLRDEIATGRVELFKWCFLFWIGQVLAVGGLMGVMLRVMR